METILVEISHGSVVNVSKMTHAPRSGVFIVDHDVIKESPLEYLDELFDDIKLPEGKTQSFIDYREQIYNKYAPHIAEEVEEEFETDFMFFKYIQQDAINHLDLRTDIENLNIVNCRLKVVGYVGNRPANVLGSGHEGDKWAIECISEVGAETTSYIYTSKFEYNEDLKTLNVADGFN